MRLLVACLMLVVAGQPFGLAAVAQKAVPIVPPGQGGPKSLKGLTEPDEPAVLTPAAVDFKDARYKLSFHVPAGWNFEKKDGVLSNFGSDVRTTKRRLDVRGVATINFNPWPVTTFAGATFYYSVMPKATAAACGAMATTGHLKPQKDVAVGGLNFKHGQDHHGLVCTESRDEVFTTMSGGACLRFDLVVNTFCSQTSGMMDINDHQLGDVDTRLAKILDSIRVEK